LLELGTGPGTDYRLLSEKYKVTGSDFSAAFISHLKRAFPTGDFIPLNAATLDLNQRFDAVYSNKVLHHLTDAELMASVKKQAEILNDNGVVCHSFWKGSGAEEFKGMFVNYHEIKEIKRLFSIYFEIVNLREYKEFEVGDSVLLIGRKKPEGPTVM
jgi:cyclopropane fatty-acyl-phospholipid synthase-like methyltransferase